MTPPPPVPPNLDAALAARAAAGDRQAFGELVRRHQRPLFGFLGRLGLQQGEAEEIAQEAFVRVWQNLARFDPQRAAFSTWLYTIARRLALNLLTSADRQARVDLVDPAGGDPSRPAAEPISEQAGPPEALQAARQRAQLQAALHTLSLDDRSVLALAYLQDLSLADLARVEGISVPAAKARLHRARQRLRDALQPHAATVSEPSAS